MSEYPVEYRLKIPSQSDNLELIREFVAKVASKVGFQKDDVNKIELAVDEACANIIKHAYTNHTKNNPIDIVIDIDYQKLTILIADQGKGFDVNKVIIPDMHEYLAQMRVGGLGIYLMKTLMDEVDFDIKPGIKNQVKMTKYFMKNNHKTAREISNSKMGKKHGR